MVNIITGLVVSYLIGSIPTAFLFGKFFKGIDIRTVGSGNVGATNALRVLGKPIGIMVLLIDILKGFIPVYFLSNEFSILEWYKVVVGLACVCGHSLSIFLKFKGGKGVATSLGVLTALGISVAVIRSSLLVSFLIWVLVYVLTKYISLSSVVSAISVPISLIILKASNSIIILISILSLLVIFRHKSNIIKLLHKKENRTRIY